MIKYECEPCGYIYDPAVGDPDAGIQKLHLRIFQMTGHAQSAD